MSSFRGSFLVIFVGLLASKGASFFVPSWHHHHQYHRQASADGSSLSFSSINSNLQVPIVIALTREEGKNEKLRQELTQQLQQNNKQLERVDIVELPCIAHADGPDFHLLKDTLSSQAWDYVTITSPEAARVLASAWSSDAFGEQCPMPKVAAVGKATEETLNKAGIPVAFCPSKATAKVLVKELPAKTSTDSTTTTVLYPASARAKTTLQDGLTERGFAVTRLNTYDTVTATWTPEQKEIAAKVKIVCVASPSSLKGWLANTRDDTSSQRPSFLAACIGETSAQACRELGFTEDQIFYPEKPGIPGWVETIEEALESLTSTRNVNNDPAMTASTKLNKEMGRRQKG